MTQSLGITEYSFNYDKLYAADKTQRSTKPVTLYDSAGNGLEYLRGDLLGLIDREAGTPVADPGNTGTGTIINFNLSQDAKLGDYKIEAESGDYVGSPSNYSPVADPGNTGNGTVTVSSLGTAVKVGTYLVECISADGSGAVFGVYDPDSNLVGSTILVPELDSAALASNQINVTIANLTTAFVAGDKFTIVVLWLTANGTVNFTVFDPDDNIIGYPIQVINQGPNVNFSSNQINFTINPDDGTGHFVAGDKFTLPVEEPSTIYAVKSVATATDGSQVPDCILVEDITIADNSGTPDSELGVAYRTGGFNEDAINYGSGHTAASVKEGLRQKGIILHPSYD